MLASTRSPEHRRVRREVAELAEVHRRHHRRADLPLLREAYRVAAEQHEGQTRNSGEPYITHPAAVARIIAELGLDTTTVAAALLHDTVEDTDYTLAHLRAQFGDTAAELVDGVTKLDKIYFGEAAEAETFRKMILAARTDIRVLIIKIADRLHNMRTLGFKATHKRVRTATVTRDLIIPLADRLGLYTIRRELEDLVFAILEPEIYQQIDDYLRESASARRALTIAARRQLVAALRRGRTPGRVYDRPRHHYSIYREMVKRSDRGQPRDPPRLVVVVSGDTPDCYAALGVVHCTWAPVPGRFTDLIAAPKYNLYQSLHTTVAGPADQPMDVLIRTRRMHSVAEAGIAADLAAGNGSNGAGVPQLEWLDRLLAWQQEAAGPDHFLDSLRSNLAHSEITVVTATGAPLRLPSGSTCVDVAYQVDPIAADRLVGACVNDRLSSLSTPLADGDRVELIHARPGESRGPSRAWLRTARTPYARLQIAQAFTDEQPIALGVQIRDGAAALARALHARGRALPDEASLAAVAMDAGYPDREALFLAIQQEKLDADGIAAALVAWVDRPTPLGY
jgi:guanosine-3',5'-bis(diphosphate) 3'-pyrophosphohydrolase